MKLVYQMLYLLIVKIKLIKTQHKNFQEIFINNYFKMIVQSLKRFKNLKVGVK